MKLGLLTLCVLASGCAAQNNNLTFDQRMQLVHAMQANYRPLPPPQQFQQTRAPVTCLAMSNSAVYCQ